MDKIKLAEEQLRIATEARITAHEEKRALTDDEDRLYKDAVKALLEAYAEQMTAQGRQSGKTANDHAAAGYNQLYRNATGYQNSESDPDPKMPANQHLPVLAYEVAEYRKRTPSTQLHLPLIALGVSVFALLVNLVVLFMKAA